MLLWLVKKFLTVGKKSIAQVWQARDVTSGGDELKLIDKICRPLDFTAIMAFLPEDITASLSQTFDFNT